MFQNPEQSTGLDFTSGLWLLNEIDAPGNFQAQLTELAKKDFTENLGGRVHYIYDKQGLLLPNKIPFQLTTAELENIKKGSGYDYLINIQAVKLSNEQSSLTPGGQNYSGENSNEVQLIIYDLNTKDKVYSQKVIGYSARNKSNEDVHFVASSPILIIGAYKKLIKDINKKSIR